MEDGQEDMTLRTLYLLAIVFVVDGHIPLNDLFDLGGLMGYYSFHLLLFAFGSGCLFRLHGSFFQDLLHRTRRILLPLYIWNLIYGLLATVLRHFFGFSLGEPLSAYTLLLAPVLDGQHFVWNLGSWFLFPLFVVQVIYACLARLFRKIHGNEQMLFIICLIIGCFTVVHLQTENTEPLWLHRALVLLPGYAGGMLYMIRLRKRDTIPSFPYLICILLFRALLLLCVGRPNYLLSNGSYFNAGPIGVYVGGALAIAFWLRVARIFAPSIKKSPLALYASRHTMAIMMHHYMGFFAVNSVFLLLNWMGLGAADFSISSFRTTSGYIYAPGEPAAYAVLYMTAGLLFPLAVSRICDILWRHFCCMKEL